MLQILPHTIQPLFLRPSNKVASTHFLRLFNTNLESRKINRTNRNFERRDDNEGTSVATAAPTCAPSHLVNTCRRRGRRISPRVDVVCSSGLRSRRRRRHTSHRQPRPPPKENSLGIIHYGARPSTPPAPVHRLSFYYVPVLRCCLL